MIHNWKALDSEITDSEYSTYAANNISERRCELKASERVKERSE